MKVLHVTPTYYPATYWGGPIWSTKAICDGVSALPDVTLRVLTTDASSPVRGDRVVPADLPYDVHYARRWTGHSIAPGLLVRLPAAIAWADVVHLTGTYNMPTLPTLDLATLLGKPLVWSPRGALQATQDWADAPNQSRKRMFEWLAQRLRPAQTVLHVTAQAEATQSVHRLPDLATAIIPNAVDVPARRPIVAHRDGGCRLIYLGRLHPKKGLSLLFDAVAKLPTDFTLDVYGTGDADYVSGLQNRAKVSAGRIQMHGHVAGVAKAAAFAQSDLFVLPSHSENFGIAVAEAMAHGLPVLTTTGTPWGAVDAKGCGRCIDLAMSDLAAEIETLAANDLPAMGARGRAWMARDFSTRAMVAAFAQLYGDLCAPQTQQVLA